MARVLRRVVLDAAPLIAVLRNEPHADAVVAAIGNAPARISTVTLAEVGDVLERLHGWRPSAIAATFEGALGVAVDVVAPSVEVATRAGSLRARHYRRRANAVSLGDCFVLATAERGETVVTSDRGLARTARLEKIDVELVPHKPS